MRRFALSLPLVVAAPAFSQLSYIESSTGLAVPAWDGGRTEIELADLNLDGHPDLVTIGDHGSPNINTQMHGVTVWFGNGAGAWSMFQTGNFGYGGIDVADLNGDGKPDIAYGMHHDYSSTDFGDQLIEAALGDGTGMAWTPWDDGLATNGEKYGMFGTALADLDTDGDFDIASVSFGCCAGVHVYRNNSDGTWTQTFGFVGGNSAHDAATGDIDNDGYPDFVVAHQQGTVYRNNHAASFVLADAGLPADGGLVGRRGPHLGDVNGDARDDLSYAGSTGAVRVFLRTSAGGWTDASAGLPASGFVATRLADMNGDGQIDLVAYRPTQLVVWAGNGGVSWTQIASISVPTPGDYAAMAIGDADHNGYPDIALVTREGTSFTSKNKLRFFKESTAPSTRAVRVISPPAGRLLEPGSSVMIDWASSVPAGLPTGIVDVAAASSFSGPWTPLVTGAPDNGRAQVIFPGPGFDYCLYTHLRVIVTVAGESVTAVRSLAPGCIADCNNNGVLTVADFGCMQTHFVSGGGFDCNCDNLLTVADFGCFQTKFVQGCP